MAATQDGKLPGGARLTQGEAQLLAGDFMTSTAGFFLRSHLLLTDRRLWAVRPNTLLAVLRVGSHRAHYPIEHIAGVAVSTRFSVGNLLLGILSLIVGLPSVLMGTAAYSPAIQWTLVIGGALLVLIGIGLIIGSPKQAFEITNSGGGIVRSRSPSSSAAARRGSPTSCRKRLRGPTPGLRSRG